MVFIQQFIQQAISIRLPKELALPMRGQSIHRKRSRTLIVYIYTGHTGLLKDQDRITLSRHVKTQTEEVTLLDEEFQDTSHVVHAPWVQCDRSRLWYSTRHLLRVLLANRTMTYSLGKLGCAYECTLHIFWLGQVRIVCACALDSQISPFL